jgi:hypothetical protein
MAGRLYTRVRSSTELARMHHFEGDIDSHRAACMFHDLGK